MENTNAPKAARNAPRGKAPERGDPLGYAFGVKRGATPTCRATPPRAKRTGPTTDECSKLVSDLFQGHDPPVFDGQLLRKRHGFFGELFAVPGVVCGQLVGDAIPGGGPVADPQLFSRQRAAGEDRSQKPQPAKTQRPRCSEQSSRAFRRS